MIASIANVTADYGISYRDRDKQFRSGFGIEFYKGWEVYLIATAQTLRSGIETEAEAIELARTLQAKKAAKAAETAAAAAVNATATQPAAREYRTKRSAIYGTGRVYQDQPGATQYDDGSGRFNIQIWDEA